MAEVLFEITKDNLETGLRGYPVGYCTTSSVDPMKGLFYVGRPVSEIDHWEPEQVIYLLYHGNEGTPEEVAQFSEGLRWRASCSRELIHQIEQLPRSGHPMKLFAAALLLAGIFEGKNQYREDCLNLIAKIPEIAATVINHHAGWGRTTPAQSNKGYMERFTQMLNLPEGGQSEQLHHVFKLFNILHYDHGGGNLSAFVGKAVASGLEDLYGSMSAAMCALAGPRHGKANQDCLIFVQQLIDELGEGATADQVEAALRQKLANHELIFGFGHAVLRVEDPRATLLYEFAQQYFPTHPLVKMAILLRQVGAKVLKENPKISNPYPNIDAISGILLTAAGFPYPDYFTVLFGLARVVGISRQIVYEREEARDGKGTPIVRPKYFFTSLTKESTETV
jgi:citrate synthase